MLIAHKQCSYTAELADRADFIWIEQFEYVNVEDE